ncbi:unnamed protein product, partial [Meganyctiphanes norvegica]
MTICLQHISYFFPNTGKIQKCRVVTFTDTCYYNSDGERAAAADRDVTLIPPANSDVTHTPALPLASPNSGDSSSRQVQHNTTDGDSTNYSVEPIRNINADQDTHSDISFSSDSDNDVYSETSDGQFLAPQSPSATSPQGVPLQLDEAQDRRYPRRPRRPINYYESVDLFNIYHSVFSLNACSQVIKIPKSYKEAIVSPQHHQWSKAMRTEIESLKANHTYDLVSPPPGCRPVGGKWIFSCKSDPDHNYKFKARFVAQGYTQNKGINYTETYAPTAHITSIRCIVNIAVQNGFSLHQLDVNNAYLNSDIDYEVYMKQPEGFTKDPKLVCRLNKSIYGLKQSAFLWNATLTKFMASEGLTQSISDPCVFVRRTMNNLLIILIWVDDIIIAGSSEEAIVKFKENFGKKFKIKDLGILRWFLGIQFDVTPNIISMNQTLYCQNIINRFGMSDCVPRTNPCDPSVYELLGQESELCEDKTLYQEIIGSLLYIMIGTRPDIAFVVTLLSRFMNKPTNTHMSLARGVLRYLKYTMHYDLKYVKANDLLITGYSDANFANDLDYKSVSGYAFKLNEASALISWRSSKQTLPATSTCESEYMALHEAACEALFLRELFSELIQLPEQTPRIWSDNMGAIGLAHHQKYHKRSKHIANKFHATRWYIQKGYITVKYV